MVQCGLLGTADPDESVPLSGLLGAGACAGVDGWRAGLLAVVKNFMELPPSDRRRPGAQLRTELLVFLSTAGHHGNELPPVAINVREIGSGAELAVGDINEVVALKKRAELVDIADVNRIISAIAAENVMKQGDSAIGGNVETKDELLEIRSMVLVVALGDARFRSRGRVGSEERHRCGVEMDAPKVELEILYDTQG